ncbi:hypothetical protein A4H97_29975 [Niastella yeongjuensis]|uniref:TonB-dependent receptor plug domain-containing protein n=1 Tax=Niastella yeongjuensis TaxID=354355 RepID=A0A1V9EPH4_9BACT|nr:TonB-dependent receptor [Niastella yeongjuensis]OQP48063.1 hypothetical protein A4H97_29975 [Niastella yeongjuensis]SEO25340.1 TonB-dependent Receptor Plug Domain [Niastella yeongjuensis]
MKITRTLVVALLLITASVQGQKITYNGDSVEVASIFQIITDQTGFGFIPKSGALNGAKKVNIHVKDKHFLKFLTENLCKDQPFNYYLSNSKSIVLYPRESPETIQESNEPESYGGQFVDDNGKGVENISIVNLKNQQVVNCNSQGKFLLQHVSPGNVFKFSGPEIEPGYFTLTSSKEIKIGVKYAEKFTSLDSVVISTGIINIAKKDIGSINELPSKTLQQRPIPDIYKRMEGFTPGLLLTVNQHPNTYQPKKVSIGGRTTLFSGADPLIVLNGFPFLGRLEDINPDDIETTNFLRDASTTTLWGALSGNSVIVANTKPLKFNQRTTITFNAYVRTSSEPDVFAKDMLPPADRFTVDSFLARSGYYNAFIRNPAHPYVPEAALYILNNTLSDANRMNLRQLDVRNDMEKYFYRHANDKHLALQVSGGKNKNAYLFSAGFDHALPALQFSKTQRLNLSFNYITHAIDGMEVTASVATTYNKQHNIDGEPEIPVTYSNLVDESGEPAVQSYKRNKFFIDSAGVDANNRNKLRDWRYRPLNEFRTRNNDKIYTDNRIQLGVKYNKFAFLKGLEAGAYTQYEIVGSKDNDLKDKDGFYVNDLVNSYTQVNGSSVERPIPVGDILDYSQTNLKTFNIRAQLSYAKNSRNSTFNILLGSDRIVTRGKYSARRIYDYTKDMAEGQGNLNYQILYRQYYFPASSLYIPYLNDAKRTVSNNISYYATSNFQLKGKYHASVSARTDQSNIYGSNTNWRLNPFGAVAAAWDISEERFFHRRLFDSLKLRTSIGLSGNPPLGVSAVQTISKAIKNENGDVFADINNPSLPNLKWETVMTYNLGLGFSLGKQILTGTIDYYYKKSTDVVDNKTVDPTVGLASIMANAASMASHNIDVVLSTKNINNKLFSWYTKFLFSYLKEFVIQTDTTLQPAWVYCDQTRFSAVPNRPIYGIYSFPSTGLDNAGDPVSKTGDKDYQSITTHPGPGTLNYKGSSTPSLFGSVTNEFSWQQIALSITFIYKLNYYYRKPSVNYTGLFNGTDPGSPDFANRWQKPGDENRTSVPRMQFPGNNFRDFFYIYSDQLVKRADFIRLNNIYMSYNLPEKVLTKLYLSQATLYTHCDNAGIVWRATKSNYDPDNLAGYPQPTVFTFGFRGTFK